MGYNLSIVLLPLGLLFVSNVVNMLAGTNGLSAGMSFIAATGLGTFAILNGKIEAALIAFGLAGALLGFLKYNWYPASILPGDSMTYLCGAGLFSAMVIGNMEKFGVFIFLPWFLEFFLKLRSGFRAHSWGTLEKGKLKPQHRKNYSLTHPLMRRGLTEKQITLVLISLEVFIVILALFIFQLGCFNLQLVFLYCKDLQLYSDRLDHKGTISQVLLQQCFQHSVSGVFLPTEAL